MPDDNDDIEKLFAGLNIRGQGEVNILLLGETGVGKSTFINSIANYLNFTEFDSAQKHELLGLISSQINVFDKNTNQRKDVFFGSTIKSDQNELLSVGVSATQDVKSYVFTLRGSNTKIRLIDTPGVGDTRALNQDKTNLENMLSYIENLQHLHAICVLLKPKESRLNVYFEYCIKAILSHLDKTAAANIVFVFTNTQDTNYNPGETYSILAKTLDGIAEKPPNVRIPLRDNIFCIDNVAFRYLVAYKNHVDPGEVTKSQAETSWKKSSKECWKLLSYILGTNEKPGITPHNVLNTKSVNDVRRMINQLSQPLAEVSDLISTNIRLCERRKRELEMRNQTVEELRSKLYIPSIDLKITQLSQPTTVCVGMKCCEIICVENIKKYHYKKENRCHDPCYLTGVQKETIGAPELIHCYAMGGTKNCQKCGCPYDKHMHIYYISEVVEARKEDNAVKANIDTMQKAVKEAARLANEIVQKKTELEDEKKAIVTTMAQFANFLEKNALTPFNDAYKKYVEYLISREESLGRDADTENLNQYQDMLKQYESMKEAFQKSLELGRNLQYQFLEPKNVGKAIEELYKLKHTGQKIKELYKTQKKAKNNEYIKLEYVHDKLVNAPDFKKKGGKEKKEKETKEKDSKEKETTEKKKKNKENKTKKVETKPVEEQPRFPRPRNQNQHPNFSRGSYNNYNRGRSSVDAPPPYDNYARQREHHPPPAPYPPSPYYPPNPPPLTPQRQTSYDSDRRDTTITVKLNTPEVAPSRYDDVNRPPPQNDHYYPPPPPNDPYYRLPNDPYYRPPPPNDPYRPPNDPYRPPNDPYRPPNDPYRPPNDPYYRPQDPHYRPPHDSYHRPPTDPHYHASASHDPNYRRDNYAPRGYDNRPGGRGFNGPNRGGTRGGNSGGYRGGPRGGGGDKNRSQFKAPSKKNKPKKETTTTDDTSSDSD